MSDGTSPSPTAIEAALLAPARAPKGARKETMDLIAKVAGGHAGARPGVPAAEQRHRPAHARADRRDQRRRHRHHRGGGRWRTCRRYKNVPYRIRLRDETGFLTVAYFRGNEEMLKRMWPIGQTRLVSGKIGIYDGMRQMLHPDHVVDPAKGEAPPPVEPVYPLTQGLPGRTLQRTILAALDTVPEAPEWLEAHHGEGARLAGLSHRA